SRTRCCSRHCHGGRSMFSTKPVRERTCAPTAALPSTSSSASGRVVWNTVANPCRARRCGGQRVTSRPSTRTTPPSTRWKPEMQPRRVDFPAPFGPIRQVSEPAATSSETSSTALTAPNAFVTPVSSQASCGSVAGASGRVAAATYSGYLKHVCRLLIREAAAEIANRRLDHVEERRTVLVREAREHRVLELGDRLVAGSEHATALWRDRRRQRPAVVRMRVSLDEAVALERVDDLAHGLWGHERPSCELRRGERRAVPAEHAKRRELERRQTVRRHALADAREQSLMKAGDGVRDAGLGAPPRLLDSDGRGHRAIVSHRSEHSGAVSFDVNAHSLRGRTSRCRRTGPAVDTARTLRRRGRGRSPTPAASAAARRSPIAPCRPDAGGPRDPPPARPA